MKVCVLVSTMGYGAIQKPWRCKPQCVAAEDTKTPQRHLKPAQPMILLGIDKKGLRRKPLAARRVADVSWRSACATAAHARFLTALTLD